MKDEHIPRPRLRSPGALVAHLENPPAVTRPGG